MDGITFMDTFRKTDRKAVIIMVTARTSTTDFNVAKQKVDREEYSLGGD